MQNTSVAEIAGSARRWHKKNNNEEMFSLEVHAVNILIHILNKCIRHSFQVKAFHAPLIRCVILVRFACQKQYLRGRSFKADSFKPLRCSFSFIALDLYTKFRKRSKYFMTHVSFFFTRFVFIEPPVQQHIPKQKGSVCYAKRTAHDWHLRPIDLPITTVSLPPPALLQSY